MGKPFNAAAAAKESPAYIDVPCVAWDSDVRLARLQPLEKLRLIAPVEGAEKDEFGNVADRQLAWDFGVSLLEACIVDEAGNRQICTPELRDWLAGEMEAIQELIPAAMKINRLGKAAVSDLDAAKKN